MVLKEAQIPVAVIADIDILNSEDDFKKLLTSLTNEEFDDVLAQQRIIAAAVNGEPENDTLNKVEHSVNEFLKQLESKEHNLSGAKGALNRIYKTLSRWELVKEQGLDGFPEAIRPNVISIIEKVKKFGLYIVPVGELEGWINIDGIKRKSKWIIPALENVYEKRSPENLKVFVKEIIDNLNSL